MAYRSVEVTLVSARDLKDVNIFSKMDVYAMVSISGDPRTAQRSPTHENAGKNPRWNYSMKFTVDENVPNQNLVIQLRSRRRSLGDREIGDVYVPIKELLDNPGDGKSQQNVIYKVRKPSGKAHGELSFSYKVGEKVRHEVPKSAPPPVHADEPVTAYPAYPHPPPASSSYSPAPAYGGYARPPPVAGYGGGYAQPGYGGYASPPVAGYGGYPAPMQQHQGGYGYGGYPAPMQQQAPARKNKFGMGLGAGLVGGALGGMMIGDMVSDAASFDAGYDAGFDDGGGFDF